MSQHPMTLLIAGTWAASGRRQVRSPPEHECRPRPLAGCSMHIARTGPMSMRRR
ncbi:hypothetical protein SXCC_04587 [Gluconacetobacter sp. SXCC-1]|nr:hypothetical protein SXCC_04587 [Gluconacetobacter sp. SXCC-1]